MTAIVLAAGRGRRLRPFTDDRPKCMVELAGVPLLHRQLSVLRSVGVERIVVVAGYRADRLHAPGTTFVLNPRYDETNMVHTLFRAKEWMEPGEDLLVSYGDIVYEARVLEALLAQEAPVAVAVDRGWRSYWEMRMEDPLADAETLRLRDGNRIVELGRKPNSYAEIEGQYIGLVKVAGEHVAAFREAHERMDRAASYDGRAFDDMHMTSFLQHLVDTGWDVRATLTEGGWLEVDTAAELERYQALHEEGRLERFMRL